MPWLNLLSLCLLLVIIGLLFDLKCWHHKRKPKVIWTITIGSRTVHVIGDAIVSDFPVGQTVNFATTFTRAGVPFPPTDVPAYTVDQGTLTVAADGLSGTITGLVAGSFTLSMTDAASGVAATVSGTVTALQPDAATITLS